MMLKKVVSFMLILALFSLFNGVYAESITVKLPDNTYYDAYKYIEFDESTTVYDTNNQSLNSSVNVSNYGISNSQITNVNPVKLGVVKIAKDTNIKVYLNDSIDTAYAEKGESVNVMVKDDYIVNNKVIIPQGSTINGTVILARHAGNAGRNGKVSILFDKLILPEGETFRINAEKVDFEVSEDGSVMSTAATAAGAILLGAAAGSVFTGSSSGRYSSKSAKDYGSGAAAGAIITGVVVVGYLLLKKGNDAVIPQYTEINIKLADSIDIPITDKY